MILKLISLLPVYITFTSSSATLDLALENDNFRERCRKSISGFYADMWNEGWRAQESVQVAKSALEKLNKILNEQNIKLKKVQDQIRLKDFDPKLVRERDNLVGQIRLYEEQILAQKAAQKAAMASLATSEASQKSVRSEIEQIFTMEFTDDPEGKPRQLFYRLTWKSPCPKYRSLCPLPERESAILKKIAKKIPDEERNCEKYASL